jgi:hypothetical protein
VIVNKSCGVKNGTSDMLFLVHNLISKNPHCYKFIPFYFMTHRKVLLLKRCMSIDDDVVR